VTLDSRVFVLDPISPQDVFWYCRRELLGLKDDEGQWRDRQGGETNSIGNPLGQGFPAILDVSYRTDAPLYTPEQAAEHEEWCDIPGNDYYSADDGDCDGDHGNRRACWLEVSFDTAYGYSDSRGFGCGDLHAEYIAKLGTWLDGKNVRWLWVNEFTSEAHGGEDRYKRLIDLGRGGFEASAWFRTTVLPALKGSGLELEQ
jgi:hypothetical protein